MFRNKNAELVFGYPRAEALGKTIFDLIVREEDIGIGHNILANLVKTGGQWNGQFPLKRKSGELFLGLVTNTLLHDDDGEVVGVVGFTLDTRQFLGFVDIQHSLEPSITSKHKRRRHHGIPSGPSLTNLVLHIPSGSYM